MKFHQSSSNDPAYNLALEEYLFKAKEDIILLYINRDSVICGKHQNPFAESNSRFLYENHIPLLRRFSGGGTVYHDLGNVNFSFITTGKDSKVIDFEKYARVIQKFLRTIQIRSEISPRNDLCIDGYKITGHAAHAKSQRALHHGTLLFDSQLQYLSEGLRSNKDKFVSRAVQSVRSPVTNIRQNLKDDMDINVFVEMLVDFLCKTFQVDGEIKLAEKDNAGIHKLIQEKYSSYEWNYGYGPDCHFTIDAAYEDNTIHLQANIQKGIILAIQPLEKTTFDVSWSELEGKRLHWPEVQESLKRLAGKEFSNAITPHFF